MIFNFLRYMYAYVLRTAKRRVCTKFHQESFKTERLVSIETDGHDYIDSARRPDQ